MNARVLYRSAAVARPQAQRQVVQPVARRFASSEALGEDFIRERQHHKEHAASE